MTHAISPTSRSHSRLIRFLADLSVADVDASHRDFAERLGLLFNFADSIILSDALKAPRERTYEHAADVAGEVKAECLRVQGNLVRTIVEGCVPGSASARIKWPALKIKGGALPFDPYLRFYLAQQREIDLALRALRSHVRAAMKTVSPGLEQLAMLDIALEDTLWDHARRFFSVVPRFLERRFDFLLGEHLQKSADESHVNNSARWMQPDQWLARFGNDMQGLLLAELEVRLQPVLGLMEALEKEVNNG